MVSKPLEALFERVFKVLLQKNIKVLWHVQKEKWKFACGLGLGGYVSDWILYLEIENSRKKQVE